ncbi:MAG: hypothetical protein SF051_07285 [Elusimicrobiota bacterium]|nr:hypothetical protein [Elusimicrobiota bacterium]
MSEEPTPQTTAAPPPAAPDLGELFERSLTGLIMGRAAYAPLAERPAPSYGALTALALAFAVAAMALNAALTAVSDPALLGRFPPWFYAAVAAAGVGVCLTVLLLSAVILHGLGRAFGSQAGFERAFQTAAMLHALAPLQSLTGLLPLAWLAPSALFVWAGAGAMAGLLRASFPGALAACALLAGLSVAGQAVARAAYAKSREVAAQAQVVLQAGESAAAAGALLQSLQAAQAAGPGSVPSLDPSALGSPAPAAPGASGLDLLRGGGGEAPPEPADARAQEKLLLRQGDALRSSAEGMLESMLPMLDNPAITKNLDAQGRADLKALREELAKLKAQSAAGTINARDHASSMQRLQEITMRLMTASMAPRASGAAPEKKR